MDAVLKTIVEGAPPCLGPGSRIDVWRTPEGAVHRLYYHGDPMVCSHPPSVYFSADGEQLEVVAMEPVTDANRDHYAALHARHQTGASKSECLRLP